MPLMQGITCTAPTGATMGILIKNVLAIVPKDGSDAVERHDIYIDGKTIAALDAAPAGFVAETTIDGTGRYLYIP